MNERELFIAALQMEDPAERQALLDQACGGDAALRQRIEALLGRADQAGSFLESPPLDLSQTQDGAASFSPGAVIGPYKLVEQIGEGGMGTVWMAQQTEPVKRLVAVKLIKAGMDSKQVIARFEAERQALALMDHTNIARVLDGGTTDAGRPYFVMDLVKGVPITRYCDEHHLTPRQRLELFIPVCQAVQHAHQKGIIHRDLKPSNVLVALYDGKPVPKVIDFGVAKAAGPSITEKTLVTGFGAIVGTLEYMSPEQAEINQLDIDTRSDIYALGVLLYELLTGSPPFSRKELEKAGMLEMLRVIREEEPSKPSMKLSSSDALPTLSANRGTEPAKLTKLVRGELDWIVMKALEKDRSRRYETANGFAMDVQRYLADEPVQACPPSVGYRTRKFVRRNKGPVLAATLVVLALVGGVIGTTSGMIRATRAEADAVREAGEKTVALGEKEIALATAKAAQKDAQENLKDALAAVDQMLTRVAENKLRYVPQMEPIRRDLLLDALKFYQKFLEKQSDDPVIRREAALAHRRVGGIRRVFGQFQEAEGSYRTAIAMIDQLGTPSFADPAFLREMVSIHIELSWVLGALGRGEEAAQAVRRAVELAEKLDGEVPINRSTILNARNQLAGHLAREQPEVAEKMLRANLDLAEDAFSLGGVHRGLGHLFQTTRRWSQAEESFRQAVKYAEQTDRENPSQDWVRATLAWDQQHLARVISAQARPAESEPILRRAVLIFEGLATDFSKLPVYRQNLADALIEHAALLKQLGQTADAEKAYRRAIDIYEKLARDFPTMPAFWQAAFDQTFRLGQFLKEAGRIEEATRVYRDAGSMSSRLPADVQGQLAHRLGLVRAHLELGRMLSYAGKKQEAETAFRQAVTLSEKLEADFASKPEHRLDLARGQRQVVDVLMSLQRWKEAERCCRRAISLLELRAIDSASDPQYQGELTFDWFNLGTILESLGQTGDAIDCWRRVVSLSTPGPGSRGGATAFVWLRRAQAYLKLGDCESGVASYLKAVELNPIHAWGLNNDACFYSENPSEKQYDPTKALLLAELAVKFLPKYSEPWHTLGVVHYRLGDFSKARAALAESIKISGGGSAEWFFLAMIHWHLGEKDEARRWYDKAAEWMEKHKPRRPDYRRYWDEAAELLEIKPRGK